MTKSNKRKATKRGRTQKKPPLESWLTISNLVLTAIIGIGIAIYLNIRNERFQEQLVDRQNDAKLANIEITYKKGGFNSGIIGDSINGRIIVKNNGPASSENIRISICLETLNTQWKGVVDDISQFNITLNDVSRRYEPEISKSECGADIISNLLSVDVGSLAPQGSISFVVKGGYALPSKLVGNSRKVHLLIPFEETGGLIWINRMLDSLSDEELSKYVQDEFDEYLINNNYIATFSTRASCNNCVITNNNYSSAYSNPCLWIDSDSHLTIYSIESLIIADEILLTSVPPSAILRNEKAVEAVFELGTVLYLPNNLDSLAPADGAPIYLLPTHNLVCGDYLMEVNQATYESSRAVNEMP
jgi:hypothetical protein